jgi:hypothetical protein
VVRPFFAPDLAGFALALLPAMGVLATLYLVVRWSVVAFEEETLARAEKLSRMRAAVSTGNWHLAGAAGRERRGPFRLPAQGPRLVALLWKNLLAARASVSARVLVPVIVAAVVVAFAVGSGGPGLTAFKLAGAIAAGVAPMLVLLGPELARFDLRQDLPMADLLKTYPLRGWQLVLGELLAPALILSLFQILCAGVAAGLFPLPAAAGGWAARAGLGLAAALVLPAVTFIMLAMHNAVALWFPAWVKLGPGGAQGFEAMGQRMLLMLGQLAFVAASLLLPVGAGALVFLVMKLAWAWFVALPLAAAVGSLVLAVEAGLLVKLLGDRFERMDLTE